MTKYRIVKKVNTDSSYRDYSHRYYIQKQGWFGMWYDVDWHYTLDAAKKLMNGLGQQKLCEPDEVVWEGEV